MTHKIKTYEGACKALKLNPKSLPDVSKLPKKHQAALVANYKLIIIAQALNEGWEPNWDDGSERKYYPWFKMGSGFGCSDCGYADWSASSGVCSRLCFKSYELAIYAGKQFKKLYKDYMVM